MNTKFVINSFKLNNALKIGIFIPAVLIGMILPSVPLYAQKAEEWKAPASVKDKKNPSPSNAASIEAGKKSYIKECLSCHGKKGKGDGPNASTLDKTPGNLTSEKVQAQTDGELFWKMTEGRKPMPSAKKTLTEEERWNVINYLRDMYKQSKK